MDQRILVPFDKSEPAATALDRALEQHPDAEITVLHVLEMDELAYGGGGAAAAENVEDARKEEAEELFDDAQKRADAYDVALSRAIKTGNPGEVIVGYAEENDIDNIIMGSHGRSGLSGILVGSVAETVVQSSPVTVTIAR
ncbi:MAG: universal stress protein [Euryarchaeota archaeon]|nr:universal stress protein [Euryarchaeota archaeon]